MAPTVCRIRQSGKEADVPARMLAPVGPRYKEAIAPCSVGPRARNGGPGRRLIFRRPPTNVWFGRTRCPRRKARLGSSFPTEKEVWEAALLDGLVRDVSIPDEEAGRKRCRTDEPRPYAVEDFKLPRAAIFDLARNAAGLGGP